MLPLLLLVKVFVSQSVAEYIFCNVNIWPVQSSLSKSFTVYRVTQELIKISKLLFFLLHITHIGIWIQVH